MMTKVKTLGELDAMRVSGQMLAAILQLLKAKTEAGCSTKYLADLAAEELRRLGGQPTFLGYQGFPDVLCASINQEVVHGIPSPSKIIKASDIVSLDFGVTYNGMVTDSALSFIVDKAIKPEHQQLVEATERAMYAGIDVLKDHVRTGDIGAAVEMSLGQNNYGVVRDLVGHGVGHHMHEEPNVPNYGHAGSGTVLAAGMTIAIEPMATLGGYQVVGSDDGWTIITKDGSLSAHFEHSVLITQSGAEILTALA
ncbi:MAG: type I methionyl aminopeptidase [Candidatus Saccharimonadales bacterium]